MYYNYFSYKIVVATLATTLNQLAQLLTHVQIFMNNNDVNSETLWLNLIKCYTTSNMFPVLGISLFSR